MGRCSRTFIGFAIHLHFMEGVEKSFRCEGEGELGRTART